MKVLFNPTTQFNSYIPISSRNNNGISQVQNFVDPLPDSRLTLANFSNINFQARGMKPDMVFLLGYADRLKCAYSGKPMLMREDAEICYKKLSKRQNAQSAINLLQHLQVYMHDVEREVFELLKDTSYKKKINFQDILQNYYDYSLEQLEQKQFKILNGANRIIKTLSEPVKEQVLAARDEAITNLGDSKLARCCLGKLKNIKAQGKDLEGVINIFHTWYALPCPSKDIDAFIVKYAQQPHEAIAKRLISSSVATVEHVRPSTRNGADGLSNYVLVSAQYNNSRSSMPLWEYIMLNPELDIGTNLQKYIDDVILLVNDKKSSFSKRGWYPEKIRQTLLDETQGAVDLNLDKLFLTKQQKKDANYSKRLYTVYKQL